VSVCAQALHLVINFGLFRAYRSSAAWAGLALTSALYAFAYTSLAAVARPVYGDGGALVDGGGDLNLGGVTSYYHDLIWLSAAVQLGSLVTRRAWWLFLVVRVVTSRQRCCLTNCYPCQSPCGRSKTRGRDAVHAGAPVSALAALDKRAAAPLCCWQSAGVPGLCHGIGCCSVWQAGLYFYTCGYSLPSSSGDELLLARSWYSGRPWTAVRRPLQNARSAKSWSGRARAACDIGEMRTEGSCARAQSVRGLRVCVKCNARTVNTPLQPTACLYKELHVMYTPPYANAWPPNWMYVQCSCVRPGTKVCPLCRTQVPHQLQKAVQGYKQTSKRTAVFTALHQHGR